MKEPCMFFWLMVVISKCIPYLLSFVCFVFYLRHFRFLVLYALLFNSSHKANKIYVSLFMAFNVAYWCVGNIGKILLTLSWNYYIILLRISVSGIPGCLVVDPQCFCCWYLGSVPFRKLRSCNSHGMAKKKTKNRRPKSNRFSGKLM